MNARWRIWLAALSLAAGLWFPAAAAAKEEWLPVDPADLALKDNPKSPGASAMVLYREVIQNDADEFETVYLRIKVFTEEGQKWGSGTTVAYDREHQRVTDLKGRTIHPDGSIAPFNGQVYEEVLSRTRATQKVIKRFALPDVTPGSIVEYKYTLRWTGWLATARWIVPIEQLYQRQVHFEFTPAVRTGLACEWITFGLPNGQGPVQKPGGGKSYVMDIEDVPAFEKEPFMPPAQELQARVLFFYSRRDFSSPDEYWKKEGKSWGERAEFFMGKRSAAEHEAGAVLAPGQTDEQKLRALYARVQGLRNLSFEPHKVEQEAKRELPFNENVEDVLKHGYGHHGELNRTFVALTRAAGFDATLVKVTDRDEAGFHKEIPSPNQFTTEIARVRQNGKDLFLDPGTLYCPFGVLPWEETAVTGFVLDKDPPVFITTPQPQPESARLARKATLTLDANGAVKGTLEAVFSGQEALLQRLHARNMDEEGRRKHLEDLVRGWLPSSSTVHLENAPDWTSSEAPLRAAFRVEIPDYGTATGHRLMLPATLFAGAHRNPFPHARRVHPIYFHYPYVRTDEVTISLPEGVQVESLPKPQSMKNAVAELTTQAATEQGAVHFTRQFLLIGGLIETKYYAALQAYFEKIQVADNEQAVLSLAAK
jgi:hypothetical protein